MPSGIFHALNKEAQFTKEMLGSGATQIRNANYASKGAYFQAFTSLSTGFERIGKLCLILDYYIDHHSEFPSSKYMKDEISHNIELIYQKTNSIISNRSIPMTFLRNLDGSIHKAILSVLSEFALGDRYSNINLLVGNGRQSDPIATWFTRVDKPLFETCVSQKKKDSININAQIIGSAFGPFSMVMHTSETGEVITDLEKASQMTGMYESVVPYRQLYIVQSIRYWVEILSFLQYAAMGTGSQDIPCFTEIFALFCNEDVYIKTRRTWDKL